MSKLWQAFRNLPLVPKIGAVAALLVMAFILIAITRGIVGAMKDSAYQKREAAREVERAQLLEEKRQLQAERQKLLNEATEAHAMAEALKAVVESKRGDITQTVKELEAIENEHNQRKAEVEAAGGQLSVNELAVELCRRMQRRGIVCPE